MPTYLDVTRTSTQGAAFAFTVKKRLVDPAYTLPPGFYEYGSVADFTLGGHYGCSARFQVIYVLTPSATVPITVNWTWAIKVRVTVNNGHGVSTTQDVVIDSGSEIPSLHYVDKTGSISGTFSFSVGSSIFYDITESQPDPSTYTHPPYTVYNQYERSTAGSTAVCTGTVNGTATTATGAVSTPQSTQYRFNVTASNQVSGSLAGVLDLLISAATTNSIAVPNYSFVQFISADLFVLQTNSIELKNTGTDDAFGDPAFTSCTLSSYVALKRNIKMLGKINAFNDSYPDPLTIKLTGLDNSNRTIVRTGNYEENDVFHDYSLASTITVGGVTTPQSASGFSIPATIKSEIIASSLTAVGDDNKATRLAFRGWNFQGCSMSLANEYQILAGGTSNTRSYSPTQDFASYRYLDVEVKLLAGTTQSGQVQVTSSPGADVKTWDFTTTSSTYEFKRIDLISPGNRTSTIDTQDNPYPRLNPTYPTSFPGLERVNSDYYGITRAAILFVSNTDIQLNRVYLRATSQSCRSNFIPTFNYGLSNFDQVITPASIAGVTVSYYGRRFWQVSVEGRNEEEYDIYYSTSGGSNTWVPLTISDFVSRVLTHTGWSASIGTSIGSGITAYANSVTGYATWLGGIQWKAATGGGTDQKDWINVIQNQGEADTTVRAQTIFDEINGNLIPDYFDPFGVYKSTDTWITLPSASILRGSAHGNVLKTDTTNRVGASVFYTLTSTGASRGSGVTDSVGEYTTGLPKGLPTAGHTVTYSSLVSDITPNTFTGKRTRRTFKDPSTAGSGSVSADVAGDQTVTLGIVESGTVYLWFTPEATPTSWYTVNTGITGAAGVDIRYSEASTEQRLILVVSKTAGTVDRYETDTQGGSVSMAVVLGTGTRPAVTVNPYGVEYVIWRTSGGAIQITKRDAQGNVLLAATTVVASSVADDSIDIYWRLDTLYIVYRHTVNGITVVTSTDDGDTFS